MRLFIDNIFCLVDYFFLREEDAELRNIWRKMIGDYHDALLILHQPQEYTDEDTQNFQNKIDDFYNALKWEKATNEVKTAKKFFAF